MGVEGAHGLAPPGNWEVLALRAKHVGGPEQGGERLAMLSVGQDGDTAAVGVLAQMPSRVPGKLAVAGDVAGVGHPGQAQVGRVGQHRGEHHTRVGGRQAGV